MTTGDVVYSLRFSLIKILPEPGFDLGSTAGESCVLTARLHMLYILESILKFSIDNAIHRKSNKTSPNAVLIDGDICTNKENMADAFNNYFADICTII